MNKDIDRTSVHYKGTFANIYDVNIKYPNGGTDGDYVEIDGWAHYWNADRGTWSVNAERDSYWDEKLSSLTGQVKALDMQLTAEQVGRTAADSEIQKKNEQQDTNISNAQNGVTANTALISKLSTDISTETSERKQADTTLQKNIDAEAQTRNSADNILDGKISAEATARSNADATLQGKIDTNKNGLSAANERITDVERRLNEAAGGGLDVSVEDENMTIS